MPSPVAFALFALLGLLLAAGGLVGLRLIGAQLKIARRLAGARQLSIVDVLALGSDPSRPVRVSGRVRTPDPINGPDDEPIVAIHRDVAVLQPGSGWRTIERLRLTREALGLSQAELCRRVGFSPAAWNNAETGDNRIGIDNAIELCKATGVTLDWIFLGHRGGLPQKLAVDIERLLKRRR